MDGRNQWGTKDCIGAVSSNIPVEDNTLVDDNPSPVPPELPKQPLNASLLTPPPSDELITDTVPDPINPVAANTSPIPDLGYSLWKATSTLSTTS
jgi:hypothetical protein